MNYPPRRCKRFPKLYQLILFCVTPILLFTMSCGVVDPEDEEKAYSKENWEIWKQNSLLGKGINLGNALDAPYEGAWGVVLKEEYFEHIAELGFSSVRIPVRWSAHHSGTEPYIIDESFFQRVEWAVDQALQNDLRVVLNMHHYEELMENPEEQRAIFLALWEQISSKFSSYGPELYFELCNEPMDQLTPQLWNHFAQEALEVVRHTNPYRSVLIGPGLWNSVDALGELVLPEDNFLIATVHYYKPDQFTHQGAIWVEGSNAWLGTKWRATDSDTTNLLSHFDMVDAWAQTNSVPVYLGEYGALDSADTLCRVLYTSFITKEAINRQWSFAYWKYSGDFGIYDDSLNLTRDFLVDALLEPETIFKTNLEIALEDTMSVDPGSDFFVTLDDFEHNLLGQNRLAVLYSDQFEAPPESSYCWWTVWHNDSSQISDNQGKKIYSFQEAQQNSLEPNVSDLIGNWGKEGNGLWFNGHLYGSSYPFIGIGTVMPGVYNEDWFDFSNLTSISFWAKGKGEMRVEFTTDTILNGYSPEENWGHFGAEFSLTEDWQKHIIPVSELRPKAWSQAQQDNLSWEDGMHKVTYISFATDQSYGIAADDQIEMYLDDIRLYGLRYEDFGLSEE